MFVVQFEITLKEIATLIRSASQNHLKKWIGHGSEEMVNRYTHLRPDFMQAELERVPDFVPQNAEFDPFDPPAAAAA